MTFDLSNFARGQNNKTVPRMNICKDLALMATYAFFGSNLYHLHLSQDTFVMSPQIHRAILPDDDKASCNTLESKYPCKSMNGSQILRRSVTQSHIHQDRMHKFYPYLFEPVNKLL